MRSYGFEPKNWGFHARNIIISYLRMTFYGVTSLHTALTARYEKTHINIDDESLSNKLSGHHVVRWP